MLNLSERYQHIASVKANLNNFNQNIHSSSKNEEQLKLAQKIKQITKRSF